MFYVVSNVREDKPALFAGTYAQCVEYLRSKVNRSALPYVDILSAKTGRYVSWSF